MSIVFKQAQLVSTTTTAAMLAASQCLVCGRRMRASNHHGKEEYFIDHWILNGLPDEQKLNLHRGPCFEKLTAIPVDIGAFAFLVDVARSVGLVNGYRGQEDVKVLHATCGIGVSSLVLSMFFGTVHMGDYQPAQLEAARHNMMNMFNLANDPKSALTQPHSTFWTGKTLLHMTLQCWTSTGGVTTKQSARKEPIGCWCIRENLIPVSGKMCGLPQIAAGWLTVPFHWSM